MSANNGAEAASSGIVRNSALSFVAHAQPPPIEGESSQGAEEMGQAERLVPAGLKALCDAYSKLYPDQPNPLQVTTRLKYWLGGQDPLDYISMYWNPGRPEEHIPPHWHYVSFGLSDLHGDGRVHAPAGARAASGLGSELTFRLAAPAPDVTPPPPPPLWPAALLQALARYVFTTGNTLCAGDHISWHAALDGSESRVRHLLVAEDPQLPPIDTPHGTVSFIQLVGCTGRELRAAQRGSGFEVLKLMSEDHNCGGSWLVTVMKRRLSARRIRTPVHSRAPAQLAGVSARLQWLPWRPALDEQTNTFSDQTNTSQVVGKTESVEEQPASPSNLTPSVEQQIKDTLQRGLSTMSTDRTGPEGHTGMSTDSFEMSSMERALPQIPESMQGSWRGEDCIEYLDGVHLIFDAEAASLLPLAIDGRVLHGRHFTWRAGAQAVTFLAPTVAGAFATASQPYACKGGWLQIVIPKDLAEDMSVQVGGLSRLCGDSESSGEECAPELPRALAWPSRRLALTVLP